MIFLLVRVSGLYSYFWAINGCFSCFLTTESWLYLANAELKTSCSRADKKPLSIGRKGYDRRADDLVWVEEHMEEISCTQSENGVRFICVWKFRCLTRVWQGPEVFDFVGLGPIEKVGYDNLRFLKKMNSLVIFIILTHV